MKKEIYGSDDVERMLRELAAADGCRMDDAMTERCLAVIDEVFERHAHRQVYRRLASCAAVLALAAAGLSLFFRSADEVPVAVQAAVQAAPPAEHEGRAMLSHLDSSMVAGFSPRPQETYAGKNRQTYGVSVYGHYEYSACTDTL
ncbi:MAG TPA: hypothetical protein H9976_08305 [Candidatus Akkermansia intestinavium]|nr:hypothetical protein [Candidatus Akkermansia intestinavium]